ncbi:MAG: 3'(2'),5'-bisphosphate nucleotidase CysQ [Halomonas sp.]|nr:3'(2'),5'-bisphosphate nucleotidase CysQ [Halomonas sp.]
MPSGLDHSRRQALLDGVEAIGQAVLAIYRRDFAVQHKADDSPLTEADLLAHRRLLALLDELTPDIPVLSEESANVPWAERRQWVRYWLVDPIDGTKEFVNRNGEFTLNVALIEGGMPVFGIVHAPVLSITWWGEGGKGAWKRHTAEDRQAPDTAIRVRSLPDPAVEPWVVVGSRLHGAQAFETFCRYLPGHRRATMGSSLKLCLVAEGAADLYPRLAPTSEWDTAAAHAVVLAAGGEVCNMNTLDPLRYNTRESLANPNFIVFAQRDARWIDALARMHAPPASR